MEAKFEVSKDLPPLNPELQEIMEEQRNQAAKFLVEELNQKFFNTVAQ